MLKRLPASPGTGRRHLSICLSQTHAKSLTWNLPIIHDKQSWRHRILFRLNLLSNSLVTKTVKIRQERYIFGFVSNQTPGDLDHSKPWTVKRNPSQVPGSWSKSKACLDRTRRYMWGSDEQGITEMRSDRQTTNSGLGQGG